MAAMMVIVVMVIIVSLSAILAQSSDENAGEGIGQHCKDVQANDDQNPNDDAGNAPLLGRLVQGLG